MDNDRFARTIKNARLKVSNKTISKWETGVSHS